MRSLWFWPRRGQTNQPRATPWGREKPRKTREKALKGRNSRPAVCRPYRALSKVSQSPPRALPGAILWPPLRGERNTAQHQNLRPPVGACARRLALGRWRISYLPETISTSPARKPFVTHVLRVGATNSASLERRLLQGKRERTCAMLRITVHQSPESCTFQLEGRLAGVWVREVEECRRRILAGHRRPSVRSKGVLV